MLAKMNTMKIHRPFEAHIVEFTPPEKSKQTIEKRFYIDASQKVFAGHFPTNPILPGVLVLGLLKSMMAAHFDTPLRIAAIKRIKFLKPILPEQFLSIQVTNLDIHAEQMDIVYQASVDGQIVAKGSLILVTDYSLLPQDTGVV